MLIPEKLSQQPRLQASETPGQWEGFIMAPLRGPRFRLVACRGNHTCCMHKYMRYITQTGRFTNLSAMPRKHRSYRGASPQELPLGPGLPKQKQAQGQDFLSSMRA